MTDKDTQTDKLQEIDPIERRQAARSNNGSGGTPITINWESAGEKKTSKGTLQDLSQEGICLRLDSPISLTKTIELRLRVVDTDFDLTLSSEVCWVRSRGVGEWLVGCSFESPLPPTILTDLALDGIINRRDDPRHVISLTAFARQELHGHGVNVRLEDYWAHGFRMFAPVSMKVGERVMVLLNGGDEEPLSIAARSLWQLECDGGYHIGCCFLNSRGSADLVRVVQGNKEAKSAPAATGLWADYQLLAQYFLGRIRESLRRVFPAKSRQMP